MQSLILSLTVNVILCFSLVLSIYHKRIISWYSTKKKTRREQRNEEIRKVVREYLEELKND